jgi:uptake hydrogenase small subunit
MSCSLYWICGGGCDGDSMSLLNMESPHLLETCELLDIEVVWHPSLSRMSIRRYRKQNEMFVSGERNLDILCVEGAVIRGPGGTGMYDILEGRPKKDLIAALAQKAKYVVAVGTCASFGGVGSDGEIEACGMQFLKKERGGFMGQDFKTQSGLPVINLPGCPCHPDVVKGALSALVLGTGLELDEFQRPKEWYGMMVHQGCTRNEYHEYRVEEKDFGEKGCLFFYKGCHGPLAHGPCNKSLWNRRSSKTRAGVPCFGCTQPDFPQRYAFFETRNIEGIPLELPEGLNRAHYMAYKGMAAAAAPERLKKRKTGI